MLNVGKLEHGLVLDHIQSGKAMSIYQFLRLDKLDCQVAIIKNARSNVMQKKDIIKIEGPLELLDLNILGYIDHNITINIIENGEIIEKKKLTLPKEVRNILKCKNPRCITSIEQELPQVFLLTSEENETYSCMYCEEQYS
ncbi:aspartate carbamoyltransferase regulatory subunit [Parasporobacterium paucivorans]|uniref:Aspartate carbamoyltransferase regulatory subunit n=1 Tax=Parasporobacterium paucivorans DSM 15970 TaxID=1122934 RepID=A0A1M6AKN7_9FIRM|nr:aspartate carbamoyltransferase regulatory subunit [Parasporobacterium paucivorans]SHI37026.1 aspartate carbamoyltransferase regulatory subunit [Parasporobacterium paucivorans DSM 15970]